MERIPLRRGRGGRRRGENKVAVFGNWHLFQLFECNDIDVLLTKLGEIGVQPYVSGWEERRFVAVSDYNLPEDLRARAWEIAATRPIDWTPD